jgi:uncharacterized protein (DUF342 family)
MKKLAFALLLIISCNDNKSFEIKNLEQQIKVLKENAKLKKSDSISINNKVSENKKRNEVIQLLDSIKKNDNEKYKWILEEASTRSWREIEEDIEDFE